MESLSYDARHIEGALTAPLIAKKKLPRRLVHYTSAEAAHSIISTGKIWLRNARLMNDAAEMTYAMDCIEEGFSYDHKRTRPFWDAVDRSTNGRGAELRDHFSGWTTDILTQTYIACISEHHDKEDRRHEEIGRLSMWRAYGQPVPVALIVKSDYMHANTSALGAYSYPVAYWFPREAQRRSANARRALIELLPHLNGMDTQEIYNGIFRGIQTIALSLKHPGFHEEREWRVIFRPQYEKSALDTDGEPLVRPHVRTINAVPQKVFELPLRNSAKHDLAGISPADILDRVMIGPCETDACYATMHILAEAMKDAGITDPYSKLCRSLTPLRR